MKKYSDDASTAIMNTTRVQQPTAIPIHSPTESPCLFSKEIKFNNNWSSYFPVNYHVPLTLLI